MHNKKKHYRYRDALPLAIALVTVGFILSFILTAFLKLIELLIPEWWKGNYHGFIVRVYSNSSTTLVPELPLRLFRMNLNRSNLSKANLGEIILRKLNLSEANFQKADLQYANFMEANLSYANLSEANLSGANLMGANLSGANLSGARLIGANLSNANLDYANLFGAFVYATSAWNVKLEKTHQSNLIITRPDEPLITVDNLEVAQFIYLLLNNEKIRNVIDTITSKVVLILGSFAPERKIILDALRDELRNRNYTPVLFDFEKPASRDFTETVRTLAHLSRFILADLTDPSSLPQELQAIVPDLAVPVQPLLLEAKREYSMAVDFKKYDWVLPTYLYKDCKSLIASLQDEIIDTAEKKASELNIEKTKRFEMPLLYNPPQ